MPAKLRSLLIAVAVFFGSVVIVLVIALAAHLVLYLDRLEQTQMVLQARMESIAKRVEPIGIENGIIAAKGFRLLDVEGNVRGYFGLTELSNYSEHSSPQLLFQDKDGTMRAALGCVSLEETDSGATIQRAPSSLLLFDKEGKVIFKAPLEG